MLMCIQNLVKFCPLVFKILSGNKNYDGTRTVRGSDYSHPVELSEQNEKKFILSTVMCIQNLVKFCPLVLKILSGNEVLTSIKGCYSVTNLLNLTLYNPSLDLINCNVHTKFGLNSVQRFSRY